MHMHVHEVMECQKLKTPVAEWKEPKDNISVWCLQGEV